ncbi:MAG: KGG domain-containing protein [Candidatus Aquicultorales bacterium]
MAKKKKSDLSVSEAGKMGGEKTKATHGHEFYEEIGHKGGEAGGKKGGRRTAETHGHEFYEEIGHKGGQKVKRLVEKGEQAKK